MSCSLIYSKNQPCNHSNAKNLKESNDALDINLSVLLKSLPQECPGPVPRELQPPRVSPGEQGKNTGQQYQTLLLNHSFRGIELYVLPQAISEIWRGRQTRVCWRCWTRPRGSGRRTAAQWGTRNESQQKKQLIVGTRTNFVHVIVTLDLFSV